MSFSGQANYTWGTTFPGLVPLEDSAGNGTIAACWYASTSFAINLSLSDGQTHQVALDVTNDGTSERFDVMDSVTGAVLNSEVVASSSGSYLVWNLKGNVTIQVINVGPGANAVVNGIFFGSTLAAGPTVSTSAAASPSSVTGTTAGLRVLGADPSYPESDLTYTWSTTSAPTGVPRRPSGQCHEWRKRHHGLVFPGRHLRLPRHDRRPQFTHR